MNQNDSTLIHVEFVPFELGYTEKNLFVYLKEAAPIHFIIKGKILKRSKIPDQKEDDNRNKLVLSVGKASTLSLL